MSLNFKLLLFNNKSANFDSAIDITDLFSEFS